MRQQFLTLDIKINGLAFESPNATYPSCPVLGKATSVELCSYHIFNLLLSPLTSIGAEANHQCCCVYHPSFMAGLDQLGCSCPISF
jgi:hypothetical protein